MGNRKRSRTLTLNLGRPVPSLACACEYLEPLNPAGASIVTWHRHSTSALHPDKEAQSQGFTLCPQGGDAAPLTKILVLQALYSLSDDATYSLSDDATEFQIKDRLSF